MIKQQSGSALIISLLVLLVLTMLGVTSMGTATLEERMAANDRNHQLAFQNAETTLVRAEQEALSNSFDHAYNNAASGAKGYYLHPMNTDNLFSHTWDPDTNCISFPDNPKSCYIVEIYQLTTPITLRITARGVDTNGNSIAMVQSYLQ